MSITIHDFLPQGTAIEQLLRSIRTDTLVHAYLLTGEEGVGKRTLVRAITSVLLCKHPASDGKPCGECESCKQLEGDSHPDLIRIQPGKPIASSVKSERTTIPIDDIREMIRVCSAYSFEGGRRVVVIEKAETMTVQAANCLLKTLEEPPENTFFFLITSHPELLLTTIVSRCRTLKLHPWDDDFIRNVLAKQGIASGRIEDTVFFANGSIGSALMIAQDEDYWELRNNVIENVFNTQNRSDLISFAASVKDKQGDLEGIFNMCESLLSFLLHSSDRKKESLSAFAEPWIKMSLNRGNESFCRLFDAIRDCRKMKQSSVGTLAVIENLLYTFMEEKEKWQK